MVVTGAFSLSHEGCGMSPHVDLTCIICKVNVCDILYKFTQQIYCIFLLESLLFAFVQAVPFIAFINQNKSGGAVESGP